MAFRWRSWMGVATGLFLLYGAANLLAAIFVPLSLITGGSGGLGSGGVVFSQDGDAYLLGGPLSGLRTSNPKLDTLLVSSMVGMCGQMIGLAVLFLALTWFGFRRGHGWALWTLLIAAVIGWPHIIAIVALYSSKGAPVASGITGLTPFFVEPLLGFAAGFIGLRRLAALELA